MLEARNHRGKPGSCSLEKGADEAGTGAANQMDGSKTRLGYSVYCASGSGRSWKCKTLLVVPLPPSA